MMINTVTSAVIACCSDNTCLINHLIDYGLAKDEITVISNAGNFNASSVRDTTVVFFEYSLNWEYNVAAINFLAQQIPDIPVIIFGNIEDENAFKLLAYGAQDLIFPERISTNVFKRTLNNAICRKTFSKEINESNKKLTDEISMQKRRLDHILSTINEVVWSCTADTFEVIYINNACHSIYGYGPEEIIGQCGLLFGRVHSEDKKHYKNAWRELLKNGRSVFEYRIYHRDGTIRYIKNEAVLRRDANNVPRYINGFARDVTEQKRQLLKIQKQNEQLKEIAWIQSHKVRGPLASIMGLTDLFSTDMSIIDSAEVINDLQTAAHNLDEVIHEIVRKSGHYSF